MILSLKNLLVTCCLSLSFLISQANAVERTENYSYKRYQKVDSPIEDININNLSQIESIKPNQNVLSINLSSNFITDEGCKIISSASTKMPNLKTLNLFNNGISEKGIEYLSKGTYSNLEYLNLCFNKIGDSGVKNLMKNSWQKLNDLHINKTGFGALAVLTIKPILEQLKHLDIGYHEEFKNITHILGALTFVKFINLTELNVQKCNITPADVTLLTLLRLDNLERLILDNNLLLKDDGINLLLEKVWPCLVYLNIEKTGLTIVSLIIIENKKIMLPKSPNILIKDDEISRVKGKIETYHEMGWFIEQIAEKMKLSIDNIKKVCPEIEWQTTNSMAFA